MITFSSHYPPPIISSGFVTGSLSYLARWHQSAVIVHLWIMRSWGASSLHIRWDGSGNLPNSSVGLKTLLPDLTRSSGGYLSILVLRAVLADLWLLGAGRVWKSSKWLCLCRRQPGAVSARVIGSWKNSPLFFSLRLWLLFLEVTHSSKLESVCFPGYHLLDSPLLRGEKMLWWKMSRIPPREYYLASFS